MEIKSKSKTLDLSSSKIMAILNITPDSFSDGGQHKNLNAALNYAENALKSGASILDIGGESTRPNAQNISLDEELTRVIPVIEAVRANFDCWISIDTTKAQVMREAVAAGADLINDVKALQEADALETAAKLQVPVCLMHMQGNPRNMQIEPMYGDLLYEINHFFAMRIAACERAGINSEQIILDPGFGFGKTLKHNYHLLANLSDFRQHNLPLLVGMSRKSMIYNLVNTEATDVIGGSVACACLAAIQGASIIRVHDVKETFQALKVIQMLENIEEENHESA